MSVYRSAMGKNIDMTSFSAQNEKVRAVGNMNVNARGDILDSNNRVIKDNTKRVKHSYANTVTQPTQESKPEVKQEERVVPKRTELTPEEQMFEDDDEDFVKDQKD